VATVADALGPHNGRAYPFPVPFGLQTDVLPHPSMR
jgi:hypothetical protein